MNTTELLDENEFWAQHARNFLEAGTPTPHQGVVWRYRRQDQADGHSRKRDHRVLYGVARKHGQTVVRLCSHLDKALSYRLNLRPSLAIGDLVPSTLRITLRKEYPLRSGARPVRNRIGDAPVT